MNHVNIENIDTGLKRTSIRNESMIYVQKYKKKCKKSIENSAPKTRFLGSKIARGIEARIS